MSLTSGESAPAYYDPYDFEIDTDPYPVWKRLRDESPLYYNEKYDFYAVSRFTDVEEGLKDWQTFSSARGTVLELIKNNVRMSPGSIIFEDPPTHDIFRSLLARLFTPARIAALEPQIRKFCVQSLDRCVETGRFDFIADLGSQMPMKTIGMLLGIPEEDQEAVRDRVDAGLRLESGEMPKMAPDMSFTRSDFFPEFVDRCAANPGDDITSKLLQVEFEDAEGVRRRLTREELLGYIGLLSGAGNETTTRLIGWTGKVLAEHPDQRAKLANDFSLIPNAIEELLRFEAPSPVQARYVTRDVGFYGETVPEGSTILLMNGAANRDDRRFEDPDRFDVERKIDRHLSFGYGVHFCLGASLARLEGRVALEEVLRRFPEWEIDTANAKQARTSTVRGWEHLPVFTH
ncbi:MAG: cytochrome P450 [Myxococcota bacterium]